MPPFLRSDPDASQHQQALADEQAREEADVKRVRRVWDGSRAFRTRCRNPAGVPKGYDFTTSTEAALEGLASLNVSAVSSLPSEEHSSSPSSSSPSATAASRPSTPLPAPSPSSFISLTAASPGPTTTSTAASSTAVVVSTASSTSVSGGTSHDLEGSTDLPWCRQHLPGRIVVHPDPGALFKYAGGLSMATQYEDGKSRFRNSTHTSKAEATKWVPHMVELEGARKLPFPYAKTDEQWTEEDKMNKSIQFTVKDKDKDDIESIREGRRTTPRLATGEMQHWTNTLADCSKPPEPTPASPVAETHSTSNDLRRFVGGAEEYMRHGRRVKSKRKPDAVLQAPEASMRDKSTWAGSLVFLEFTVTKIDQNTLGCQTKSKKVRQLVTSLRDKLLEDPELVFVWGIGVFGRDAYLVLLDREQLRFAPLGTITSDDGLSAFSAALSTLRAASIWELGGNPFLLYTTVQSCGMDGKAVTPPPFSSAAPAPRSSDNFHIGHSVGDIVATHVVFPSSDHDGKDERLLRLTSDNVAPSPATPFSRSTSVRYLQEVDSTTFLCIGSPSKLIWKGTRTTFGKHGAEIAAHEYQKDLNLSDATKKRLPTLLGSFRSPRFSPAAREGHPDPLKLPSPRPIVEQAFEMMLFSPIEGAMKLSQLKSPNDLRIVFLQLLDVIANFKQEGCYHGDLSTSNILVKYDDEGHPESFLIDFETFRRFDSTAASVERTGTMDVMPIQLLRASLNEQMKRQPRWELESLVYIIIKSVSQSYRPSAASEEKWKSILPQFGWDGTLTQMEVVVARGIIWARDGMMETFFQELQSSHQQLCDALSNIAQIVELANAWDTSNSFRDDESGYRRYEAALQKLKVALSVEWEEMWQG